MTDIPPPDPKSAPTTPLGFDEFIAILVAFSTVGVILFWSFTRKDAGWKFNLLPSPSPAALPQVQQNSSFSVTTPEAAANTEVKSNTQPVPQTTLEPEPNIIPSTIEQQPPQPVVPPTKTNSTNDPLQVLTAVPFSSNTVEQPFTLVTPSAKKSTIPPPIAFNDVPAEFWGRSFINALSSRGIIKGFPDYSFRPNQPVSRAEFAAILQRAFEKKVGNPALSFKDVTAKSWATPGISHAVSNGFLKGYPNKTFQPDQKISRVQVLVSLASGLNLKASPAPNQALSAYQDAKDIPQYALDKVAAATANGLVVNYPNPKLLAPNKAATRAEVAAMVHQALVRMGRLEEIPSQNIVRGSR